MLLMLYDTKTRALREVRSRDGRVTMYCCGPTVYRDAHVGNMRTFLLSDLIRRTLGLLGANVQIIQNITDVGHMSEDFEGEDKLISQSKSEKINPLQIAAKYEARFHSDLALLNILPADAYPKASQCIGLMQDLIAKLISQGNAYVGTDGCIYFDAASYPGYGELSGNRLESLKPGHRFEFTDQGAKKFHADWALWKAAGHRHELIWESPWGAGFPGWHIECSAMSIHYLLGHVDVHVGGIDLRFPHHENERAQSNSVAGYEVVDLWVHGEHLLFQGRKMSKSAGNVVLVNDIEAKGFDPLALRLVFLENRYRSQMDLTWETISAAHDTLRRWRTLVGSQRNSSPIDHQGILNAFCSDLDTPKAIQWLRTVERDSSIEHSVKAGYFLFADKVLGLDLGRTDTPRELPEDLRELLEQRANSRALRNWNESDRLRVVLEEKGLIIEDSPTGQNWRWR